jgi:hypothetical protein
MHQSGYVFFEVDFIFHHINQEFKLILLFEVDFSKYMFMRRNPYATHSIE